MAPVTHVTRFYLSVNSTLDATDVLLGSRDVPALGPAASHAGSVVPCEPELAAVEHAVLG